MPPFHESVPRQHLMSLPTCRFDAGAKPDFLAETRGIREGDWKVSLLSSMAIARLDRQLTK